MRIKRVAVEFVKFVAFTLAGAIIFMLAIDAIAEAVTRELTFSATSHPNGIGSRTSRSIATAKPIYDNVGNQYGRVGAIPPGYTDETASFIDGGWYSIDETTISVDRWLTTVENGVDTDDTSGVVLFVCSDSQSFQ